MRMGKVLCLVWLAGCSSSTEGNDPPGGGDPPGGDDDPMPPDPPDNEEAWSIDVDMSGLDRFVEGVPPTYTVGGSAVASEGIEKVTVADGDATLALEGAFSRDVPVVAGLQLVPIFAYDEAGHERKAHRSLLAGTFLPEGQRNREAAGMVLSDAIVAAMAAPLATEVETLDVAAQIMSKDTLSEDDRCTTWPDYAEHDPAELDLVVDDGDLWLSLRVPNLYVAFSGECDGLFSTIPIAGEMATDVQLWTLLSPRVGECVDGFDHTYPDVEMEGWYFDVWGTSGPLQGWMVELGSSGKSEEARQALDDEFTATSDGMLAERLEAVSVFDRHDSRELLGQTVDMHLCLTALESIDGNLIARIGATATGTGTREAPGTPLSEGGVATPAAGELLLDANLVGQMLFSAWRANGLSKLGVQQIELSLLAVIVRELNELYPEGTMVDVNIDGELPPIVSARPGESGDLLVEIGDLMIDLTVGQDRLFRFGAVLRLSLDLVPEGGALKPTVTHVESEVHLLTEMVEADDAALEVAVGGRIGDAADSLLGGAALSLPEIPGAGAPVDVSADPAGRYVRIRLE